MPEYIEREMLTAAFEAEEADDVELYGGVHIVECFPAERATEIANGIPAAEVVAVKHGRWEFKHPNGWACSECGEWGLMIDNRGICKSNYCPNCGARLDGDSDA